MVEPPLGNTDGDADGAVGSNVRDTLGNAVGLASGIELGASTTAPVTLAPPAPSPSSQYKQKVSEHVAMWPPSTQDATQPTDARSPPSTDSMRRMLSDPAD